MNFFFCLSNSFAKSFFYFGWWPFTSLFSLLVSSKCKCSPPPPPRPKIPGSAPCSGWAIVSFGQDSCPKWSIKRDMGESWNLSKIGQEKNECYIDPSPQNQQQQQQTKTNPNKQTWKTYIFTILFTGNALTIKVKWLQLTHWRKFKFVIMYKCISIYPIPGIFQKSPDWVKLFLQIALGRHLLFNCHWNIHVDAILFIIVNATHY